MKKIIKKTAEFAKIKLTEKETEEFAEEIEKITSSFAILDKADTKGVKSSFIPIKQEARLRDDKTGEMISQKEALKSTKNKKDGFFVGPRTV